MNKLQYIFALSIFFIFTQSSEARIASGKCPSGYSYPYGLGTYCCSKKPTHFKFGAWGGRRGNDYDRCPGVYKKCPGNRDCGRSSTSPGCVYVGRIYKHDTYSLQQRGMYRCKCLKNDRWSCQLAGCKVGNRRYKHGYSYIDKGSFRKYTCITPAFRYVRVTTCRYGAYSNERVVVGDTYNFPKRPCEVCTCQSNGQFKCTRKANCSNATCPSGYPYPYGMGTYCCSKWPSQYTRGTWNTRSGLDYDRCPGAYKKCPGNNSHCGTTPANRWYQKSSACPDGWTKVNYRHGKIHCKANSVNRGNRNCGTDAHFPKNYNRCHWAKACGVHWSGLRCR